MTKEDSLVIKGFAVSSMVFMHLFDNMNSVDLCYNLIKINNVPLVHLLSIPCICVAIYLFLSGYGLYCSFDKNNCNFSTTDVIKRALLLYARFWIIFIIFIGIAVYLNSPSYLKSARVFISNITGLNTSYNNVWWFLMPYIFLVLTSKFIFRIINKYNSLLVICAAGLLFLTAYIICKFNGPYLWNNHIIYQPLLYSTSAFPFVVGALFAKHDIFGYLRSYINMLGNNIMQVIIIVFTITLIGIRIFYIPFGIFDPLLAFIVLSSIVLIRRYKWIDTVLCILGKQSTNIWLIHAFFAYGYWHDFTYSLKYPLLIFIVVMALSYILGRVIDIIYAPVQRYIKSKL